MKQIKYWFYCAAFALSAVACGAEDEHAGPPDDLPACAADGDDSDCPRLGYTVDEYGQAEQAFTVTYGQFHGIVGSSVEGSAVRCNHIPAQRNYSVSNPCVFPPRRNLDFKTPTGGNQAERDAVMVGLGYARDDANTRGWLVRIGRPVGVPVTLVCNELTNALGKASLFWLPNGKDKVLYSTANIKIDVCRAEAEANLTGHTISTVIQRTARHELMHAFGFGHRPRPPFCSDSVMVEHYMRECNGVGIHPEEESALSTFDVN